MPHHHSIIFGPLPPPYGGVSVFMTALSAAGVEKGVTIWAYTGQPVDQDAKNPVFLNHHRLAHIWALLRSGRGARITDSTHFHLEYPNKLLVPLWVAAKFIMRFRWIKVVHDGSLPVRFQSFSATRRWLLHLALANIDEFVVYDLDLERWIRERIEPSVPVKFIPVTLPMPPTWGIEKLPEDLIEAVESFATHKKRVCCVGVFIPSYGFGQVATAVEELRRELNEDIGLMLVDGDFARDEEFRVEVLKDRGWIEVVTRVPNPMLPGIYRRSDVFVRAFEHESFGISRIEAMVCGTPVVATNAGETRGMLIYEFGDIAELKRLIRDVFDGKRAADAEQWTTRFAREMDEHLADYLRVVVGDTHDA